MHITVETGDPKDHFPLTAAKMSLPNFIVMHYAYSLRLLDEICLI